MLVGGEPLAESRSLCSLCACCLTGEEFVRQTRLLLGNELNKLNKNTTPSLPPSCVHYSCEATDCPKLEMENALLNCTGGGWYSGVQCNVSCKAGYILQIQRDDELSKNQVCSAGFV